MASRSDDGRGVAMLSLHGNPPMITRLAARGFTPLILVAIALTLAAAILVPVLNALPFGHPLRVPNSLVPLLGKFLAFAMLAVALDLVWGFAGILSLGHGAFFALGGYAMGMHLMREIGSRGVYGNPDLPDFMVFLNWDALPWYWWGFDSFLFACLMVLLVPAALAFVFGWLAFRSRVTGVYLSIITQALTYALMLAFFRNEMGFGGNNGLTDFKDVLGLSLQSPSTRAALFALTAVALAASVALVAWMAGSRFGRLLVATRDAEDRTRFLGYEPTRVKLVAWVVSAAIAGVAGALYVPQVGIINPGEFAPAKSIEVVIWAAVGGRGTIVGPILGAIGVNGAKSWLTAAYPELWLFGLGALFILVTLFLPRGIVGTAMHGWHALEERRASRRAERGGTRTPPSPLPPSPERSGTAPRPGRDRPPSSGGAPAPEPAE